MFDLPPSLMSRRLDLKTIAEVLSADVMENLQPPPDDAANPDAYYRHLAEVFQRFDVDVMSVEAISTAQATADQLWRAFHPLPRPQWKATVGDRVAAARRVKGHNPPAATPTAPEDTPKARRRRELIKEILKHHENAGRRHAADAASAVQRHAAAQDADTDVIAASIPTGQVEDFAPTAPESPSHHAEPPPSTMAEFIARGDHGPRGRWMEPAWTDDIKGALRPPPLEAGESFTQYQQWLKCHADGFKPDRIKAWQVNQDFTDSKWREERRAGRASAPNMAMFERGDAGEPRGARLLTSSILPDRGPARKAARDYDQELAGNGGKSDARVAYEAAVAGGDKTAIWFD